MKKLIAALAVVAFHRSGHDRRRRHPGAVIMRMARTILDAAAPLPISAVGSSISRCEAQRTGFVAEPGRLREG